jgi:hemin uptake protein HemP
MNTDRPQVAPTPPLTAASGLARPQVVLDSSELLRGARLVEIRHNGEVYRLQATRLGKLILTK